jgi:FAD/FMN-containing dehydrogenase
MSPIESDPDAWMMRGLPAQLAAKAHVAGDVRYEQACHTYATVGAPALVIAADDASDVRAAVRFAADRRVPLSIRSGGHGPSTNARGIVIDLGRLRGVEILDHSRRLVRIEAGARWGEVAQVLGPHALALSSGDYGDVGVGGLATGAGVGLLARLQGLTIDRVRAADVVLADGTLVRADDRQRADLLWAIRGAGGSFGAVTAFEFEAGSVGTVTWGSVTYRAPDLAGLLAGWATLVERSPREVTSFLYVSPGPGASAAQARATVVHASDDAAAGRATLSAFADLAPVSEQRSGLDPYATLLTASRAPHRAQAAGITAHTGLLDHVTDEAAAALAGLVNSHTASVLQLRSVGGAVNDLAPDATAYAHRQQNFSVVVASHGPRSELDAAWASGIVPHVRGSYLNLGTDRDDAALRRAYPPPTLARLQQLKRRYDPAGVFDHSLPIPRTVTADTRAA